MNKKIIKKLICLIICVSLLTSCNNNLTFNTNNNEQTDIISDEYLQIGELETGIYRCYETSDDSIKSLLKDIYNIDINEYYLKENYIQNIYDQLNIASNSEADLEMGRVLERDKQLFICICVNLESGKTYFTIDNDTIYKNDEVKNYFFNHIKPVIRKKISETGSYVLKRTLRILDNPKKISFDLYHKINNLQYENETYNLDIQLAITEESGLVNID